MINPGIEYKKTPGISEFSKIVDIQKTENRCGIILDSPEEFVEALMVYNGGSVDKSRATQNNLMDALGNEGGGMGGLFLMIGGEQNAGPFMKQLVNEALEGLTSKGSFRRSYEYDGMGTNFFKTIVEGEKIGDKYVLELCAAYVRTEPEEKLAEKLNKPMALVSANAKCNLSIVDDWWFNVNLEDVLQGLPISSKDLCGVPEYLVSGGYEGKKPDFEFKNNGKKFSLSIKLDAITWLHPENGSFYDCYLQKRGNSIVGGAWTIYAENGNDKIDPKPIQPAIVLSVSKPSEKHFKPKIITENEITSVQEARDYIIELITT